MKKIFSMLGVALLMASCTEDYKDWASPQTNAPEDAKTVSVTIADVSAPINLAEAGDTVQIFVPTVQVSDEAVTTFDVVMVNTDSTITYPIEVDNQGLVTAEALQNAVVALYNANPNIERTINMGITSYTLVNGQSIKAANTATVKVTPVGPVIEQAYYLTGSINGWDNTNQDYKLTNDGSNPYENPTFTVRIPATTDGSDIEFKFTPESGLGGDWSGCLANSETEGKFNYGNNGGNFKITAVDGAKFYDITFNMLDQTWSYKSLSFNEYIYEAGVNNDWGAVEQPLYCANQDGIYKGFFYAQDADWSGGKGAFKFTGAFNSWDNGNYGTGTINADGLSGTLIDDGGSGNVLAEPGFYMAEVNLADMTYKLTPITIGIIGPAQPGGWDSDTDLTYNPATRAMEVTMELAADEFKFRANDDWAINWGGTATSLAQDGANLKIDTAGKYLIQFYPLCQNKAYCTITAVE